MNHEELKDHVTKTHTAAVTNVTLGCEHCDFKCVNDQELRAHVDTVHPPQPLHMETDQQQHFEQQQAKFPCIECNFVGASENALVQHKANSHEQPPQRPGGSDEGYPCDLSNHQDRPAPAGSRSAYYEEKMGGGKHPYLHLNGQDFDQTAAAAVQLSGLLPSPFRSPLTVPAVTYATYTTNPPPPTYQSVPSTISVPAAGFTIPATLTAVSNPAAAVNTGGATLAAGRPVVGYTWSPGFNMNPSSY